MKLFDLFKRKNKKSYEEPLQDTKKDETSNVELIPKIENGGLKVVLNVNGVEKDFNKLSEEEQTDYANVLYKNSIKEKDNEIKDEVIIKDDFISIPKIKFYGFNPVYSESNKYIVCSKDGHIEVVNNKDKFVKGSVVACKGNKLLFHKKISRPHDGKVSNNGVFIINDWTNRNELCGDFLIFNDKGNLLFNKKVNANLYNNGLSPNGRYACFQTANSSNEDGSKLFIVDINNKKIVACFNPVGNWASYYEFDEDNQIIKLHYNNDNSYYRYKFDGTFLDYDKLEQIKFEEAINDTYGYNLKDIAFNRLSKIEDVQDPNLDDYSEFIDLISKSLDKEMSDYSKAICYRRLGEIYENFNLLDKALDNYNKAVEYYPKIGVKRKIINISKIISESHELEK